MPITSFVYSLDEGQTWTSVNFTTSPVVVVNVFSTDITGTTAVIFGRQTINGQLQSVYFGLDFSNVHERNCDPSDYEKWTISTPCVMGRNITYLVCFFLPFFSLFSLLVVFREEKLLPRVSLVLILIMFIQLLIVTALKETMNGNLLAILFSFIKCLQFKSDYGYEPTLYGLRFIQFLFILFLNFIFSLF